MILLQQLSKRRAIKRSPQRSAETDLTASQCPELDFTDPGLPDIDGMEVIRQVRSYSSIPIIVISARTQEKGKVMAPDLGADDYITKPLDPMNCWRESARPWAMAAAPEGAAFDKSL